MENEVMEKKEKKPGRGILVIIIFLELMACGVLSWLLVQEKQRVKIEQKEKIVYIDKSNAFQHELADLRLDYQELKTDDAGLNVQLQEKIGQIHDLEIQAEKHKDDAYIISKLKKEAETLRTIMKSFVQTIDSLNTLNLTIT